MPDMDDGPVCDQCDTPATNAANDIAEDPQSWPPSDPFVSYVTVGSWKYGCDQHLTKSLNLSRQARM